MPYLLSPTYAPVAEILDSSPYAPARAFPSTPSPFAKNASQNITLWQHYWTTFSMHRPRSSVDNTPLQSNPRRTTFWRHYQQRRPISCCRTAIGEQPLLCTARALLTTITLRKTIRFKRISDGTNNNADICTHTAEILFYHLGPIRVHCPHSAHDNIATRTTILFERLSGGATNNADIFTCWNTAVGD